jgi:hypothetical protein
MLLAFSPTRQPQMKNPPQKKSNLKNQREKKEKKKCISCKGAENVSIYYYKTTYPNYWKFWPNFPILKKLEGCIYIYRN